MKIAYIGIDLLYPALPALVEAGCNVMEIFTCKTDNETEFNVKVCEFAQKKHIPLSIKKMMPEDLQRLKRGGCQAVVCGGYYYRIPTDEELPAVNIHPSLLPVGRGAWPMPITILRGLHVSGVTIHKMTQRFDEGDILLQRAVNVAEDENLLSLTKKQQALLPDLMQALVASFDRLWAEARPQGEGEYWPCPREIDYPITPETPVREADRIMRAFYGYECIYQSGENRFGLRWGSAEAGGGAKGSFPVSGGVIHAKQVKELC